MSESSSGPAFDAAGERFDGSVVDISAKTGTTALNCEQRAKERLNKDPKPQQPNRRYEEGLNPEQRSQLELTANAVKSEK